MSTKTFKEVVEHLSTTLDIAETQHVQQAVLSLLDDELLKDATFLKRVREEYIVLSNAASNTKKNSARTPRKRPGDIELKPIGSAPNFMFEPNEPPNVAVLKQIYGMEQLPLALSRYSVPRLKKAILQLSERQGAMPSTKGELIACLVASSANA